MSAVTATTTSTWPWLKDFDGTSIADPIPPVNEYDDRLSVELLIAEYRTLIDEVRLEVSSDSLYNSKKHDDLFILRFLMSHHKKVKASVKAITYTLNFRNEHHLDDMDIRYVVRSEGFAKDALARYMKYCKEDAVTFCLPDPKLGVISMICLSSMDKHSLVKEIDESDWLPSFLYDAEWTFQWQDYITRTTGRLTKQIRFVDLANMTLASLMVPEASKRDGKAMGIMEDCYPQSLQSVYI